MAYWHPCRNFGIGFTIADQLKNVTDKRVVEFRNTGAFAARNSFGLPLRGSIVKVIQAVVRLYRIYVVDGMAHRTRTDEDVSNKNVNINDAVFWGSRETYPAVSIAIRAAQNEMKSNAVASFGLADPSERADVIAPLRYWLPNFAFEFLFGKGRIVTSHEVHSPLSVGEWIGFGPRGVNALRGLAVLYGGGERKGTRMAS